MYRKFLKIKGKYVEEHLKVKESLLEICRQYSLYNVSY